MKIIKLRRPHLNAINLSDALQNMSTGIGGFYITVSPGQWDSFLEEGYFRQNATIIELDDREMPVRAYKYYQEQPQNDS